MDNVKISGSGSSVFRKLYKITQNKKLKNREIKNKITFKKEKFAFKKKRDFSVWETKIIKKLEKSDINFETKFRKFPLEVGNKKFVYIPDLLVKDFLFHGKKVLIEAHEEISEDDIIKYRKFRSFYGRAYHLIMVVNENDLREWNRYDQGKEALFHDIWTKDNLSFLIEFLCRMKLEYENELKKFDKEAICPAPPHGNGCGRSVKGYSEIEKWFGYRGNKRQSLCRLCRSKHSKLQRRKNKK